MTGSDRVAEQLAHKHYRLGDGPITVEPIPNAIRLPSGHEEAVIDYHAVARDSLGRIYVLYNSLQRHEYTRALARFHYVFDAEEDCGRFVFDTFLGTRQLANGSVHGMNIFVLHRDSKLAADEERILVVNEDQTVTMLDLDGNQCWQKSFSDHGPGRPTTGVGMRARDRICLVDGYATSTNFLIDATARTIAGQTGSQGTGAGQSNLNHGIDVDPAGDLVISDRGNTRLTWWKGESAEPFMLGSVQKKLDMPGYEVCNVDFLGRYAIVPCLNATIAFLGPDDSHDSGYKLVSTAQIPPELVSAGIDGIHDAVLTADGRYAIVAVWERHRDERQIPTLTAFRIHCGEDGLLSLR